MAASSSTTTGTTSSAYAAAREPKPDEWPELNLLVDILTWAKIKGSVDHPPSQQATLLSALGADPDTSIEEFAAIPDDTFLEAINTVWEHSASSAPEDGLDTDINTKPTPIVKCRAIFAH